MEMELVCILVLMIKTYKTFGNSKAMNKLEQIRNQYRNSLCGKKNNIHIH